MARTLFFSVFLIFGTYFLEAQDLPSQEDLGDFANEDAVFAQHNTDISIDLDKSGKPKIEVKYFYRKYFLNSRARLYNDDDIYETYIHKVKDVKALQFDLQENGKYRKIKVGEPDTVKPFSSTIFYDDMRSLKFDFAGLKEKSYTELSYTEEITDFHFFGREACASYFPIINGYLKVTVDKNIKLSFQEHHLEKYGIVLEKTESNGDVVYRWDLKNIEAIRPTGRMVSYFTVSPNITFQIASYTVKGQEYEVFPDTNRMYDWYYQKVDTVMENENDSLRDFTLTLVNDSMSDFEKVKTIYYWVQRNVKYIAIEYGSGGVIPRSPKLVYNRRYGDCKDMACLTKKMIGYVGLEANLVWIGTRDLPYKFTEVPSPVVSNHMICSYTENGRIYYLDATAKSNPIELPSYAIQGKQALIEYGKDDYRIEEVPVVTSDYSGKLDSCSLSIKGTSLIGDCQCSFTGFTATSLRQVISMRTIKEEKDFYQGVLNKGSNKFELTNYTVHDLNNFDKSIRVDYTFKIDDYVQKLDNKYFVNINVAQYLRGNKFDLGTFKYDYEGEYKFTDREVSILEIPEDFSISSVPGNFDLEEKDYSFEIDYQIDEEKGKVFLDRNISIDYLDYPVERFKEWNESVDKLNMNYKNMIVLEKEQ